MSTVALQKKDLQTQAGNKEIGEILLKVQDELKDLRTKISVGQDIDLQTLQNSIKQTENELKQKTDSILNNLNNQVAILPSVEEQEKTAASYGASLETLWDMTEKKVSSQNDNTQHPVSQSSMSMAPSGGGNLLALRSAQQNQIGLMNTNQHVVEEISAINMKAIGMGPTPGQQLKIERETRALFNPENNRNRAALDENYQISLPLIDQRAAYKMQTHLITGSTIDHLATLPLVYRKNPTLMPPPLDPSEAKHGLYSLLQRGLIPPNAKISFDPEPIVSNPMDLQVKEPANVLKHIEYPINMANENVYKLDRTYEIELKKRIKHQKSMAEHSDSTTLEKQNFLKKKAQIQPMNSKNVATRDNKTANNENPLPPPVTPSNALQMQLYDISKSVHRFVIQNGKTRTDMHDYISFKQSYCLRWGSIITIIKCLEDLCNEYSINIGFIDGLKVSDLALCLDMDLRPNREELIETFLNKDEVEKLVKMPGRRFKKQGGENLAATIIQCHWKGHRDRISYKKYRKRRWAAGVIALTWLTYFKWVKAKEKLKLSREAQLERFRKRQIDFKKNWPRIKKNKRIAIHIPSLGYSEQIRERMNDLTVREMQQMARLCEIADDNVDVIYVCSLPITEETLQYYSKLFGLRAAVITGDVNNQTDVSTRYKIVIPEALNSFPTHNMSIATLLKYSPKAMNRISNLIKGRDAYIVPGVMNIDDIHVSDTLNVPVLGSEPEVSNLYTTKSGSKRIFQSASVSIPCGEFDIYNRDQMYESLAQSIVDNLHVQRWIFKLDEEFDGRGIAYCDITKHLTCYNSALKEMTKFGDKWSKRWAYEPTYVKVLEELPGLLEQHSKLVNNHLFPDWETFLTVFIAQGGVFEAHPPSDSVTALTVSILIEPDQTTHIISSGDHIHSDSEYSCWGLSFPQTSVDPVVLNAECSKIISACKERKIIGYIDIDFVTFIDAKSDKQIVWATDLNISYSEHVAMTRLLLYMSNGTFDWSHELQVDCTVEKTKKVKGEKVVETVQEKQQRYAVLSAKLFHTNLSVIHYSVFFQTCRALGIGYDIKEKQGTIFSLIDSLDHKYMGMIAVKDNLQTAMTDFARNLTSLHKEISSANMQGETNFNLAAADIKSILQATEDDEAETATE